MKIVLSGVDTNNKGAELMLYAILQEIERKFPHSIVYIPEDRILQGTSYISTSLDFRVVPHRKIEKYLRLSAIFWLLHIPYWLMPSMVSMGKIDFFLDGSGFKYSDQFKLSSKFEKFLNIQLSAYKKKKTKIIFLPQAFGPFEKTHTKKILSIINQNAALIIPREKVSYQYIENTGIVDMNKVRLFTDFTSLVEGVFPSQYERLKNGICIIPNMQMINKGIISYDNYVKLLLSIIEESKKHGHQVYLLNHEGKKDEVFCKELQKELAEKIVCVSGLNALEVKGLIASAYLVISSRFHGVASSLNSCVPCLATSWSHKYKELFNDYTLSNCILPLDHLETTLNMIVENLQEENNQSIRKTLSKQVPLIKEETQRMWDWVWSC